MKKVLFITIFSMWGICYSQPAIHVLHCFLADTTEPKCMHEPSDNVLKYAKAGDSVYIVYDVEPYARPIDTMYIHTHGCYIQTYNPYDILPPITIHIPSYYSLVKNRVHTTMQSYYDSNNYSRLYKYYFKIPDLSSLNIDSVFSIKIDLADGQTNFILRDDITTGIPQYIQNGVIKECHYYNLMGQEVDKSYPGIFICRRLYSNGNLTTKKYYNGK